MAIKELTQPKHADQLQPQPPFGRPPVATNFEINDMHKPGELVMLSGGLYRVKSAEKMSLMLHMGISGTFTRTGATAGNFKILEDDSNIKGTSFTVPAGAKIHIGAQGSNNLVQVVSFASDTATGTSGTFAVTTSENINSQFSQETDATLLFVPSASTDSTNNNLLLEKKSFGILESPATGLTVYDLIFGISLHPKYTGRNGDITDPGLAPDSLEMTSSSFSSKQLGSANLKTATGTREDAAGSQGTLAENAGTFGGARFGDGGYGMKMTRFSSMISPKIRIEQPEGVVRFATDRSKGSDISSGSLARGVNKTGFLTADDTSTLSLNPKYRIITNSSSSDGSLPTFQLLQDNLGALRDPHILLVGSKLVLEEVSEAEVKEMIRRSGKFNYKIIEDPVQAYKTQTDGVTGPANGWKAAVESQRGRKMSYQDYRNLIENITTQSVNQLYGTAGSNPKQIREDPRRRHRGI